MRRLENIPVARLVAPEAPMRIEMDDERFAELVEDVRQRGVLQTLLVREKGDVYQVIAGHRRLLAARQAGIESVPCLVSEGDEVDDTGDMIAENILREDVTPAEEGELFKRIASIPGIEEAELARRCRRPLGYIYTRIALVEGDPDVCAAVHKRQITLGVATELNKVKAANFRAMYLEQAVQTGASIATAKQWVNNWRLINSGQTPAQAQPMEPLPPQPVDVVGQLCRFCNSPERQHELEVIWVHRNELHAILAALRANNVLSEGAAAGG